MYADVEPGRQARPPPLAGVAGWGHSWILTLPALVVGIAAVLHESSQHQVDFATQKLHFFFGLLLWISVTTQLLFGLRRPGGDSPAAVDSFTKRLARQIYLVSYLLAGTRGLQYFAHSAGSGTDMAHSMQILQPYFGCALIALIVVKGAAYRSRTRAAW